MGYIASPLLDINYMLGNLIGRAIIISLFAYALWYLYNKTRTPVYVPEQRRFGRSNEYRRYSGRGGRSGVRR